MLLQNTMTHSLNTTEFRNNKVHFTFCLARSFPYRKQDLPLNTSLKSGFKSCHGRHGSPDLKEGATQYPSVGYSGHHGGLSNRLQEGIRARGGNT